MSSVTLPRPAERAAILSLLVVFLCGAAAGALAMSVIRKHASPPVSAGFSLMSVTEMKNSLNLTDEQTRLLTSTLDDFSKVYDDVLADGHSRVLQILTPEQKKRFEEMIQAHKK